MIEWVTPGAHFASAWIGECKVADVRTERDRAVVVFYVGQIGSAAWDTPEQARDHVERFVASWLKAARLAPLRPAEAA